MIPILYESSETEFVSEGLGRLSDAISCSVTEERNGSYELEMEYPVTGVHYNDIQLKRIISAIPADGKNRQSFVIYKISRPLDGKVTINAYHISYLLSGVITAPGSAKTVSEALLLLKNNALTDCPFTFWTDKGTVANYSCDVPASIRSRLGGVTGSILDCYGGEYEWDNFTVKLHSHRGQDNGVRIAYGKNLTDIKQEESIESTVVGVYPYWKKDASDDEEAQLVTLDAPVYADNADNFPYKLVSVLDCSQEWQTAPTTDQLKAYAQSYIKNNDVGVPSVSIDVSFVALWQTEEYKNIAPLERVNLCDTVHVDFNTLGVSATAKVIKTDYDVLSERYNSITIGDARASLSDTISNIENTATQTKKETTSFFQTAIANATKLIQGGLGGHVIFNTNADGQPNEILIMDTDDKNTAVNVIRMNVNGIGFSTNGYNGPFTTAWTIDGKFNADFITTGTLNANLITAGILTDAKGTNYWNLDTGEFRLAALAEYSTTDETEEAINSAVSKTVADTVWEYAQNQDNSKAPTSGWSTTSPAWKEGYYIWCRSKKTYVDGTYAYSDATNISGANGRGESSIAYYYAVSASNSIAPTEWETIVPTITATNKYLWEYSVTTYTDGSETTTAKHVVGVYGDKGEDGLPGKDGFGVKSTIITYGISSSETAEPTSWSESIPTLTKGNYLWTRTIWTYTDDSTETGYQKTYIAKDGNDGKDGLPGKDGTGIASTDIQYAASTSGTAKPTSGWSTDIPTVEAGNYLWTRTIWTYTDNTTETGYSVAKMGNTGATGKGVSAAVTQYYLSTSETAQVGGSWSEDEPTWSSDHYIWSRTKVTWTNGDVTTTKPMLEKALNSANSTADSAKTTAEGVKEDFDTLNTQEGIFNALTNNGQTQGIYLQDSKLYINGEYIKSGSISADQINGGTITSSAFMSSSKRTDEDYYRQLEIDRALLGLSSNTSKLSETLYNTSAVPRARLGSSINDNGYLELYDGNSTIERVSGTTDIYHGKCGDNGNMIRIGPSGQSFYHNGSAAGGLSINKDGSRIGLFGNNTRLYDFLIRKNTTSGRDQAEIYDAARMQFSEDGNFCGVLDTAGGNSAPILALLADDGDTLCIGHITSRTIDSNGRMSGSYKWSNNIKIDTSGVMHIYGTTKWGDNVTFAGNWTYTDSSGTKVQYFAWT